MIIRDKILRIQPVKSAILSKPGDYTSHRFLTYTKSLTAIHTCYLLSSRLYCRLRILTISTAMQLTDLCNICHHRRSGICHNTCLFRFTVTSPCPEEIPFNYVSIICICSVSVNRIFQKPDFTFLWETHFRLSLSSACIPASSKNSLPFSFLVYTSSYSPMYGFIHA